MIRAKLKTLIGDARGATAIEYGLICGLIVIAMLTGLASVGGANGAGYESLKVRITAAMTGASG